ncbi:MAG TPA: hypothetical protein DDX84_01575 [Nitrospiraceae bacterium]|nr:hypothetical protein [Nitrospiraceae bacterium]
MEEISNFFGTAAAFLFIIANAYYPAMAIARNFTPWSRDIKLFFRQYLKVHVILNILALLAVIIHVHYAEESNIFLLWSFILTLFLSINGTLMYYRMTTGMQKQLRLTHIQPMLSIFWIVLIIVGHLIL